MKIVRGILIIILIVLIFMVFFIEEKDENIILNKGPSKFTKESIKTSSITLNYFLYTPENATKNMPLIMYLHGSDLTGNNLDLLLDDNSFAKYLKDGNLGNVPAFIIIPQLPSKYENWKDINKSLVETINSVKEKYFIDDKKISLTGFSLGGIASWDLALLNPTLFSSIAPLAGTISNTDSNVKELSKIPIWAFVGTNDKVVDPSPTIKFVKRLKNTNSNVKITVLDGYKHTKVQKVYADKNISIIKWLLSNSK